MNQTVENSTQEIFQTCSADAYNSYESLIDKHTFMRIVSGGMTVVQSDKTYVFRAGDTVLFPRNQLAKATKFPEGGQPFKCFAMYLTQKSLQKYYTANTIESVEPSSPKIKIFTPHPLLDSVFGSLQYYFDISDALPENISAMKVQEAIAVLRAIDQEIDSVIGHFNEPGKIGLMDFMENNYMFNLPLEKFAYLTGRSLTTFQRDFKSVFNVTPQRWLTTKRLEIANYQIFEKKRKPSDVYFEVGFENLSHFSFAFKKQFGYNATSMVRPI